MFPQHCLRCPQELPRFPRAQTAQHSPDTELCNYRWITALECTVTERGRLCYNPILVKNTLYLAHLVTLTSSQDRRKTETKTRTRFCETHQKSRSDEVKTLLNLFSFSPGFVPALNDPQPAAQQWTATFKPGAATVVVVQRHICDCLQGCYCSSPAFNAHPPLTFRVLKKKKNPSEPSSCSCCDFQDFCTSAIRMAASF